MKDSIKVLRMNLSNKIKNVLYSKLRIETSWELEQYFLYHGNDLRDELVELGGLSKAEAERIVEEIKTALNELEKE